MKKLMFVIPFAGGSSQKGGSETQESYDRSHK